MKLSLEEKALFKLKIQLLVCVFHLPKNWLCFLGGLLKKPFRFEKVISPEKGVDILEWFHLYLQRSYKEYINETK